MFKNYFKTAWRSLWKNKTTTFINITGLSVGMTAAVLIFLWAQNEMSFDSYHKDANNIYRLTTNLKSLGWIWETTPLLLADAAKKDVPEIEKIARLHAGDMPVFNNNNNLSYEKNCAYVDDDWFNIFHYDFIAGNAAAFTKDANSIILTASAARKYFGGRDALGSVIHADSMNYVVKAIIKDAPANSSFQYSVFIPLSNLLLNATRKANDENWSNANYITFIELRPGAIATVVSKKITSALQKNSGDNESTISLEPLKDMHFETDLQSSSFVSGNKSTVYIFSVLGILLLLIACINYVNLTTAKASLRAKEVSVRKIIGASRFHLFNQFLTEALLVSCIALITTLALIHFCLPAFNSLTNENFQLPLTSASLWKVVGATLFTAFILNSIYPAIVLSSFKPLNVFRGFTILKLKDSYLRKGLVTLQFTISVMLIAGTIVIYKQMQFIQQTNPGYNKSQVLITHLPPGIDFNKKNQIADEIKQDLLTQSSIQNVSMTNQSIVNIGSYSTGSADWTGRDTTFNPKIAQLSTDADFANTMQLQMKEGRWFQDGNEADKNNVVLNEEAIKELKIHQPYIGQRFTWKGKTGQIIGIVKDFKFHSMHDKTGPLVAFQDANWYSTFMIRVAPNNASPSIAALAKTWKKFLPGSPLEYSFLDDTFNELYKEDQQASTLMLAFAIIAVAISCLGLFGLATFTAEKRAKEIGIRKVLGATVAGIAQLLTKDFLKLVIIAIIIASPVAWFAMDKWLQDFAYRINIRWWMLVAAGLFAMTIAVLTISFQSIKAAIANPVKSLRTE
ncbi:MAG: ABC transporter permease [Bacteroidota bacterium]|nr:ABC transporter permease [Bacteroidota bacterium]